MKIRVYDNRGRERFLSAGQTAPAGWFRDGQPPVELTEAVTVMEFLDEGNPYDQDSRDTVYLRLVTASETAAAVAAEAVEDAGQTEAGRLNWILSAAGVLPTTAEIRWGKYLCGDKPALRVSGRQAPVTEAEMMESIPGWLDWQSKDQAEAERKHQVAARQASLRAAYAGIPDVRGMAVAEFEKCGWVRAHIGGPFTGSDNSRPCSDGEWSTYTTRIVSGDFSGTYGNSGESWHVSNRAGDRKEASEQTTHPLFRIAEKSGRRAFRRGGDPIVAIRSAMGDVFTRQAQAEADKITAEKAAKQAELLAAGVRQSPIAAALVSSTAEKRATDLASARKNWRTNRPWKMEKNGRHADAVALVIRAQSAQARAMELRRDRESRERNEDFERRTRAEQAAQAAKEANKARFLTGGAWGALESLNIGKH